jgi:hypothetical protein
MAKTKNSSVEEKKKKRALTKWNVFLTKHYHDKDILAKPVNKRFKAISVKYRASNKKI